MSVIYKKIPLKIRAVFMPDGSVVPESLTCDNNTFFIDKIVSKIKKNPKLSGAIAPIEYTVMVRGREKKIYYDSDLNTWFAIKEIEKTSCNGS